MSVQSIPLLLEESSYGNPCALACLCCSCAFTSPDTCAHGKKLFLLGSWIPSVLIPIFSPGKILMTLLLMHSNGTLKPCTNENIKNKAWSRGRCYSERMKLKWELQNAISTSNFKVSNRKSCMTKMREWYTSKEFLMEKIAIAKKPKTNLRLNKLLHNLRVT